jgi:hypothetical protein
MEGALAYRIGSFRRNPERELYFFSRKCSTEGKLLEHRNRKSVIKINLYCDSLFIRYNARRAAAICGKPKPARIGGGA